MFPYVEERTLCRGFGSTNFRKNMATLRKVVALTLSAALILGATSSADSARYAPICGRDFTRAVMEICATQVKRTEPLMQRFYTASLVKRSIDPAFWNNLMESNPELMDKRQSGSPVGMATHCCQSGCSQQEISMVC